MSNKLQELFKKYGKIGIGVHLSIYAATLAGELALHAHRNAVELRFCTLSEHGGQHPKYAYAPQTNVHAAQAAILPLRASSS